MKRTRKAFEFQKRLFFVLLGQSSLRLVPFGVLFIILMREPVSKESGP